MNKQYTIRVEGFVTITGPDDLDLDNVPMKIDVYDFNEDPDSQVLEVNYTEITEKEIETEVQL